MQQSSSRTRRPSLGAIFLTVFLDLLGFGLVIPFLAEEARDNFQTTALVGTLLSAVYSLMQFLFVPVWGRLSDRIGRRPVLVWSVAANALTMLGLGLGIAYGSHVGWLFAARIFGGIATANLGTASAYIADVTKPEDRARGMGLIGMAFGLGFVLGPGFGGALAKITINGHTGAVACFAAAALGVVNFVWVALGLVESLPKENRAQKPMRSLSPLNLDAARRAFADNGILAGIVVNFMIIFSFTNMEQTFRYFNKDVFKMDQVESGLLLAGVGVTAAIVQGAFMRPLTKRYSEPTLIPVGVFVQAIAFFGLVFSPTVGRGLLYASSLALAVGNGITQPTVSSYVSRRASASEQGAILGTNQSAASLARVLGPAFGGFVYGAFSPRSPYVAATIGMLLALTCTLGLARNQNTSTQMS
ncbi:MFS transporter [Pendulispora brunnea]|uniref:MFS transporter n=1 Tax=Pendulispora brunnea TaxID=2905690 RepID=A0ABZ2K5P5_9BACT